MARRVERSLCVEHVVTREGRGLEAPGKLDLEDHHGAGAERGFRPSEVEVPHSAEPLVVDARRVVPAGAETLSPGLQRLGIVETKNLDVGDQQAGAFDGAQDLGERRYVAAR